MNWNKNYNLKLFLTAVFVVVCGYGFSANLVAQSNYATSMVQDKHYGEMLSGLLAHSVPEVSVETAKAKDGAVFLDAREEAEYKVSHIKGAIWVGSDDFHLDRIAHLSKDTELVVYCSVGFRSELIAEVLAAKGYSN
ncbi:MAG: rhodanese-like domain-containing protein, partial [Chitinophagales bacterium]